MTKTHLFHFRHLLFQIIKLLCLVLNLVILQKRLCFLSEKIFPLEVRHTVIRYFALVTDSTRFFIPTHLFTPTKLVIPTHLFIPIQFFITHPPFHPAADKALLSPTQISPFLHSSALQLLVQAQFLQQ